MSAWANERTASLTIFLAISTGSTQTGGMKTLPGFKIAAFFTLVFVVALGVYAGAKDTKGLTKKHKVIVGFGWSETAPCDADPVDRSVEDITNHLLGLSKSARYKIQHYKDGKPDGDPQGNLCLEISSVGTHAAQGAAAAEPSPSGTPLTGAKTQTAGYAQFDDQTEADSFVNWVNSTAPVSSKASSKPKAPNK